MSPKRKPIPKGKILKERARRLAVDLWRDLRGKPKSRGKGGAKRNPWQLCVVCHHRTPPHAMSCGKPTHVGMCFGCCGFPHDDEDDDETPEQAPVRNKDDEDEGDEAQ
ncbi:MAG TPA: hypothetical protein VFW64_02575 [Pseudonocardiaceae bacterium]|nr:hypothetical protein [Pseudonocardiaceae bacterium]